MAASAAALARSRSSRPGKRAATMAAASVARRISSARFRPGRSLTFDLPDPDLGVRVPEGGGLVRGRLGRARRG